MKKILAALFFGAMALGLSSCGESAEKYTVVEVVVEDVKGVPFGNTQVYMFTDGRPKSSDNPDTAVVRTSTDDNGVANFMLDLREMKIPAFGPGVYFSVFYEVNDRRYIATPNSVTLRSGENHKITVTIPVNI